MAQLSRRKRLNYLPAVIAVLALLAIALVFIGRYAGPSSVEHPGWQDAVYTLFLAFTIDGTFLGEQNAWTVWGAFAAGAAFYVALFGSLWALFGRQWRAWRATRWRDHVVVVGDGV